MVVIIIKGGNRMKSNTGKKCRRYLMTFLMAVALVAGVLLPVQMKAADNYDKSRQGSITINLNDVKQDNAVTNKEGVSVSIYQIASINYDGMNISFDIAGSLASTGVDVNDITTSEKNLNAAKRLSAEIGKSGITATTKKTDSSGKVSFTNLAQGMYLVEEADSASYGMFSSFLVAIPYMEDGTNWIYDVETYTKGISNDQGSLEVTKYLIYINPDTGKLYHLQAPEASYYVGLFCDADGMIPYGKDYVKELKFEGSSSVTVKYDNLPDGTYYVFETDKNGTPYIIGDTHTDEFGRTYKCVVGDGTNNTTDNKIQLQGRPQAKMNISNMFAKIPDDFLVEAQLSIKKNVIRNGQETTTNDVFYASIYELTGTSDNEEQTLIQTVQLKQNDTVTVALPVDADTSKTRTYVVTETDADGNELDSDNFAYKISGEGNVELSMDNTEGSITLTNTVKDAEESSSEEETVSTETETAPKKTSKKTKSGKTGDTTPIMTWIVVGVVAAVVIIFLVIRRKKSE